MATIAGQIEQQGFAIIPAFISRDELLQLEGTIPSTGARVRRVLDPILGRIALPVRAILFDKTPAANWKVTWHQDLTIAVLNHHDVPGFGPWSTKAGVVHVQPPASVLDQMLAVRLHFDDCGAQNGPLRVLPGSHKAGKLRDNEIAAWRDRIPEEACLVPKGGALLMRPLLLHASSPAVDAHHRRVLHIEYATSRLPSGLEWRWANRGVLGAA
jgi:hypothetical protein